MSYKPEPINTSRVELPENLYDLVELLAINTHDTWALQRLAEGWRYGPQRNDTRKEHPCLVPYNELPESEKEIDRKTVIETVKALLALGYHIEAPTDKKISPSSSSTIRDKESTAVTRFLENPTSHDLNSLLGLWRAQNPKDISFSPEVYQMLGQRLLNLGEPLIAYDVLDEGLKQIPQDVRLRQLLALALARSGATHRANVLLNHLYAEGYKDEETLGLLARTYKDLWEQAKESGEKEGYLQRASDFYTQAYKLSHGYWCGINAATTALLSGQRDQAMIIAGEVRKSCISELKRIEESDRDRYWLLATLGEAALILGEFSEAEDWYAQASKPGGRRFGDLHSTRRNARLLLEYLGGERERIEKCFQIPRVVVFSGHMIDQTDRKVPRFPLEAENAVYKEILGKLKKLQVGFGYASAACGSDILFLEAILEMGGEAYIVLPYEKEQFMQDSVDLVPGTNWRERYYKVLDKATWVYTASDHKLEEGSISYEYANLLLLGLARIRAEQLETDLIPLAVWDGKTGDGPGGTETIVEHWLKYKYKLEIINPMDIIRCHSLEVKKSSFKLPEKLPTHKPLSTRVLSAQIMAILFADAVGFSKLSEKEVACFLKNFLGIIAVLIADSSHAPKTKNTWGDALYFVFSSVRDAGLFALELCDLINNTNWVDKGLPDSINLRIALHAGPVLSCTDPVIGAPTYIGTHVSQAARIEPITPPGQVYASQAFAALASAEHIGEFICEYIGQTPLAKGYGTFPTYILR